MKKIKYILVVFVLSLTVLSGCSLPGLGSKSTKNDVKITALSTSESQIISHMLRLLIEHDTHGKIKPTLVNNLGSSTIQHNALINGDANISGVRYNGTDLTGALKEAPIKDPKKAMIATQQGFKKEYGFDFGTVRPMQIGLVYDALNSEKLDVALGYSTDGRIAAYDLKVLKDDKQFFPPYAASAVATNELLRQHPELKTTINKLTGKISTSEMQRLNYEADGKGKEPAVVAEEFLKKHHYFDKQKGGHK